MLLPPLHITIMLLRPPQHLHGPVPAARVQVILPQPKRVQHEAPRRHIVPVKIPYKPRGGLQLDCNVTAIGAGHSCFCGLQAQFSLHAYPNS